MQSMVPRSRLCQTLARETLARFESQVGPLRPPVPVEKLAGWLGFQVVSLFSVPDEFSALVSTREKIIGVNGRHHRHRRRFSLCHELAHILLKHPPESRCSPRQIVLFNIEADECAAELLMPDQMLSRMLERTRSVIRLASVFDVSLEAMGRKATRFGVTTSAEPFHSYEA